MRFLNAISTTISSYAKAFSFIAKHKMYVYFLAPIAIFIILFFLGFTGVSYLTDITVEFLKSFVADNPEAWYNSKLFQGILAVSLWIILRIFFFVAFAYIGGYFVLLLLSPILSIVAAFTNNKLNNNLDHFNFKQFIGDIFRGIRVAIRNFIYQLLLTIGLFFIGLFPVLGWLSPIFLFGISTYFYGFSFIDYALESKHINYKNSLSFIQKNKSLSIGIGLPYVLLLLIPFIGLILAGFFAIISTVSATIAVHEKPYLKQLPNFQKMIND